ncbi:MAG: T9SS type A sorting domain-containing protein [Bacteroidetes bacterium]|nr:T9SS type A sorting domain-containing protein [Bacteroidota bacterium]
MMNFYKSYLFTVVFSSFIFCNSGFATVIINSGVATNPNGSFENATSTPAANGWTAVNDARNKWIVNTATAFAGTKSIYITTNAGTTNDYDNTATRVSHFYRDVTFPAGETCITLTFNWKGDGESCCDHLKVYLTSTATAVTAGTEQASLDLIGGPYNAQTTWQSATITIPASNAGTTKRLVFSWRNDASVGTNPPAAVDNISLISLAPVVPTYASLGYTQDFESWTSSCGAGINDIPSTNWAANPSTGNNSWRRDDEGALAAWGVPGSYIYSPVFTTTAHSARFHSGNATSGLQGILDLYVDCSPAGTKTLTFDYINTSGTDVLDVLQSTNGGSTFPTTLGSYAVAGSWTQQSISITTTSATTVIRFRATADYGSTDIGIDNLRCLLPCSGTPAGGTASASPASICLGQSSTISASGYTVAGGITFQWQSSPNPITTWTNIAGATSSTYTATPGASTNYRCVITCSNSALFAYSASTLVTITGTPTYATIPYSQSFEGPWINRCDTRDIPTNAWINTPATGNNSWRRDDDGAAAAWSTPAGGVYAPTSTLGTYSARFHSAWASSGLQGNLDLYVNLSPAGTKSLCFDYNNTSGSDVLDVMLSTDGGATFPTTLLTLPPNSGWTNQTVNITSTSATCVLRFRGTSDYGSTDIGIDNLWLGVPGVPGCATYTSPANGASGITCGINAILNWTAPAVTACNPATSYDVYFGTAAAPPYLTNVTSLFYNPGTLLPSTTYYWRIVPRNGGGAGACATVWSFATGASYTPSQTTPPITDGFETCTDWTIVNGAQPNVWIRGTNTFYTGANSMYIHNGGGTDNDYDITATSTVHFYKDITFPAGSNDYALRFYWKGMGESASYDYLRVFFAPTSVTPVAGTQVSSTYELTPYVYNQSATWQQFTNTLPVACGGNETWRLIFSWWNDGGGGTQPPIAVDDIQITTTPRTGTTCANPVNITLPYLKTGETTACMGDDYTNASVASCGSSYESDNDKVYKVLVGAAGCVNVTLSNTSSTSIGFQVYNGCPDVSGSTCIFNSTTGTIGGFLTADINIPSAGYYYVIVDSWSVPGDYVNYDITISAPGGNTANDPCSGAIPLTLGVSANGDNTCTNAMGEPVAPACWTTGAMNTIWYRVTIPASRDLVIKTTAGSLLKTQIDVYRGNSCAGLTYVDCNQDAASCGTQYDHSYLNLQNIGAGTYAYIRVDGEDNLVGTFSILVIDGNNIALPVLPPVVGQDCGPVLTYTNPICGQTTTVANPGNFAFGNICDFTGTGICLASGEKSSTWYTININANGTLAFDIVPNDYGNPNPLTGQSNPGYISPGDETDYDWSLWRWSAACNGTGDGTWCCTEIAAATAPSTPTRCNYSYLGVTGLYTTTGTAPPAYAGFGGAYEANLAVTNGEIYVLAVSNYANDYVSGYTLKFSGTSPIAYSTPGSTMTWGSSTSNAWVQAGNWGGCGPPNCGINAIIASGGAQPIISSNVNVQNITINAGATLMINPNCTLTVCGDFINNGTLTMASTATLLFNNGAVVQNISGSLTGANKIGNLVINKTGGSLILAAATPLDIGGNFVTQNTTSVFNGNNNVIKIAGNFSTASNVTVTNFPNVEFNGTIPQTYTNSAGTITWTNVTMNNSGGGMTLTGTATSNLVIAGILTLTNGIIYTANPPLLIMNAGSSVPSPYGSIISFVDGPMQKIGATAFVFPVGDAFNRWARIAISAPTAASTFQAQYFFTPYTNITSMCAAPLPVLNNVSGFEYWQLDRPAGTGNAAVTLYWENAASSGINSCTGTPGDLVVGRFTGACWENKNLAAVNPYTGSCAGTAAGTVTSDVVTAFSPFTFSSKSPGVNPLPAELLSFTGKSNGEENILEWVTASERNNDYFTLERGTDGFNFEKLAVVDGAGNSSTTKHYQSIDKEPFIGINYYRLKQTDFDGSVKYAANIIVIDFKQAPHYLFYPNPANNEIMVYTTSLQEENIAIDIADVFGRKMMQQKQLTVKGINQAESIDISNFAEGIYFVIISDMNNKTISQQKFVKRK